MALTTTPKANPTNPNAAQPTRHQVNYGVPSQTTARVEALKSRLSNPQSTAPAPAPRVAGSTARAEQYSKLQHQAPQAVPQKIQSHAQPMQDIEPPPSGMPPANAEAAPEGSVDAGLSQTTNIIEGQGEPSSEATEKPISPQFVALAKQERAIRKARQELKSQQEAWEREKATYVNLEQLKADPLKFLNENGISYDRLTELQASQINPDPNQPLLDQLTELKRELSQIKEDKVKEQASNYEAAVNVIRNDVKLLVDSDPTFETIKETGETESVVELIRKVFDVEGTILSVEEAARLVEDKLLENKLNEIERLSKLSKIKARLGKPAETSAEATPLQQQQKAPTLTNEGTISRPISARERAIMAFENAKAKR